MKIRKSLHYFTTDYLPIYVVDESYGRLKPMFQKYVLHESEAFPGSPKSREDLGCQKNCPSINNEKHRSCLYDLCTHAPKYEYFCFKFTPAFTYK